MLISFSVANFRSFGEEVTLNMVASSRTQAHQNHLVPLPDNRNVLRTAVIYGANAAGKSNLVKAMQYVQRAVHFGHIAPAQPFRFDSKFIHQPSSFEFRFLAAGKVFAYGFDVRRTSIESEWLCLVKGDDDLLVFERNAEGETEISGDATKHLKNDDVLFRVLAALRRVPLKPHQLFLNRINDIPESAQGETLNEIIRWLTRDFVLSGPDLQTSCDTLDRLEKDGTYRNFCRIFLNNVGTGICDLNLDYTSRPATEHERENFQRYAEYDDDFTHFFGCSGHADVRLDPDNPGRLITRTLMASHDRGNESYRLPFAEESDGTRHLLDLMDVICPTSRSQSSVVVIDELDRSLHPLICWEFIRFFSESCPGQRRQLIVTTHEAHLLDQELLRRDEYWFVEKDREHQTKLVSLSDFNIRNDLHVQRGYLNGRFGAIPVIGGMESLEKLLNCSESE